MVTTGCLSRPSQVFRRLFRRSLSKKNASPPRKEVKIVAERVTTQPITPISSIASIALVAPPPSEPQASPPLFESPGIIEESEYPIVQISPSPTSGTGAGGDTIVEDARRPALSPGDSLKPRSTHSDSSFQRARGDSDSAICEQKLKDRLRRVERKCHSRRQGSIIPRSQLGALVTVDVVVEDIRASKPDIDLPTARKYAERVCESAKQLYAILGHLERGADICGLLDENITDAELPLFMTEDGPVALQRRKKGSAIVIKTIETFSTWPEERLEQFHTYQYKITAPVFAPSKHYDFEDYTILPFIRLREGENTKEKEGGYSVVFPVRIHPDHHDFWETKSEDEEPLVAVKQLFSNREDEFKKEQDILLHLGPKDHPHLIKLLATFRQDKKYHLMFPFADANLRTYWLDHNPSPDFNETTVLWSLHQMRGISHALQLIHNFNVTIPLPAPNPSEIKTSKGAKLDVFKGEELFGRHGDIKPENLLWFKREGKLKIADFGLGRFHGRDSRSRVDPGTVAASPTYEPPECRLRLPVSRAYDIWSLGCLFLEFITWLLEGAKEIEGFSEFRGRIAPSTGIDEDSFYTVLPTDTYGTEATVRMEVIEWVERLHKHEKCSELIHDLLDLTMRDLLVVESKDRIKSTPLTLLLTEFSKKAEKNTEYMLKPTPPKQRKTRADSAPKPVVREPKANAKRTSVSFAGENNKTPPSPKPAPAIIPYSSRDLVGRGTPNYTNRNPARNPKTWPTPGLSI